jgi:hypothetical protein
MQGLYDGAGVVAGQVATRKAVGAIQGAAKLATPTAATKIALNIAAAAAITVAARKLLPSKFQSSARFVAAGAFSEAINVALAQTPIAPYLSAFPRGAGRVASRIGGGALAPGRRVGGAFAAYPAQLPRPGVGAYPARVMALPQQVG